MSFSFWKYRTNIFYYTVWQWLTFFDNEACNSIMSILFVCNISLICIWQVNMFNTDVGYIWYFILVSFCDQFNSSITFRTRHENLVLFDLILAIITSRLGSKFQNLWNLYLEVNIYTWKFLYVHSFLIVILILLLSFIRDV